MKYFVAALVATIATAKEFGAIEYTEEDHAHSTMM